MDIPYFKAQVMDELHGAKEYIEKAIEAKVAHPSWRLSFVRMAEMETEHAATLLKMMESCIRSKSKEETNLTDKPEEVYKDLMKEYGETMAYISNMKRGL